MSIRNSHRRTGLTLLEVVISVAIFFISLGAIWQLFVLGDEGALYVKLQARTSIACQSKLAEVISTTPIMSSTGFTSFPTSSLPGDDPNKDLMWKLDVTQSPIAENLWNVKVTVQAQAADGTSLFESQLCQMILDPSLRGSTLDQVNLAQPGTATPSSGSSSQSASSGTSSSSSTASVPAAAAGAKAGAGTGTKGAGTGTGTKGGGTGTGTGAGTGTKGGGAGTGGAGGTGAGAGTNSSTTPNASKGSGTKGN